MVSDTHHKRHQARALLDRRHNLPSIPSQVVRRRAARHQRVVRRHNHALTMCSGRRQFRSQPGELGGRHSRVPVERVGRAGGGQLRQGGARVRRLGRAL